MGFVDNKRKWLFPEEALFLMEINVLVVKHLGIPLSIQEAYNYMLVNDGFIDVASYQVYAYLRRLGYVLLRYQERTLTTHYEKTIHLNQYQTSGSKKKRKNIGKEHKKSGDIKKQKLDGEILEDMAENESFNTSENESERTQYNKDGFEHVFDDTGVSLEIQNDEEINLERKETFKCDTGQISFHKPFEMMPVHTDNIVDAVEKGNNVLQWDFSKIIFPDIGDCMEDIYICAHPQDNCVPNNIKLSESNLIFNVLNYKRLKQVLGKKNEKTRKNISTLENEELEFSFPEYFHKRKTITAKSWKEYKMELQLEAEKSLERLHNGPAACLWQGEVTPLVSPHDATCTGSILEKLQIIKNANIFSGGKRKKDDSSKLLFDMYLPDQNFKKSNPGAPDFRITVSLSNQTPPNLNDLAAMLHPVIDHVPLLWAVVDGSDISFYQFQELTLPLDITLG